MPEQLPVAGYFRVSRARDDMHAPQMYTDEIRRYCSYRKLTLGRIYSDIDFSAFRGARERPSLNELIDDRHRYSAVIIPKLSRFGRSMKQLIKLFELFDSDGIPLVFLDMNLDTSTSQGRLLRHILAAFAEYESYVKADYASSTHRRIRAEGRPWGKPTFGYAKGPEPNTWVIDYDAASAVLSAFTDYAAGLSANAIARLFNEAGIESPRGVKWKGQVIGRMLDNPVYAGLSQVDGDFVRAQWEPIVSPSLWEAVRERRSQDPRRMHNLGNPRPKGRYLLTGLVWCGLCYRRMTHTVDPKTGDGIYHCSGDVWGQWTGCLDMRMRAHHAEPLVVEAFLERCAFTILTESGIRGGSPRHLWAEASSTERLRLLSLVIDRVVIAPNGTDVPLHLRRTQRHHDVSIEWKAEMAERDEVVVVADPPAGVEEHRISKGRHERFRAAEVTQVERDIEQIAVAAAERDEPHKKSWQDFRRERLLPK